MKDQNNLNLVKELGSGKLQNIRARLTNKVTDCCSFLLLDACNNGVYFLSAFIRITQKHGLKDKAARTRLTLET